MTEELKALQEGEIEVLKSIFMNDFETVESQTAWKSVNAAHEFRVRVQPVEEELKDVASVKIHFKLPLRYPKIVPTMTLEESNGLSTIHLVALQSKLRTAATTLLGSEMIYELCSQAATFITDQHQAIEHGRQTSLGDLRKRRGEEEEKATQEASQLAALAQSRLQAAEAARLSQLISEDVRRKEILRAEREKGMKGFAGDSQDMEIDAVGDKKVKMRVNLGKLETETEVKLGICTGADWLGRTLAAEIDEDSSSRTAATAYIYDVLSPYFMTSQGKRKIAKVQSELDRVQQIRHPHILPLYGSSLTAYTPSLAPLSEYGTQPHLVAQPTSKSMQGWTLIVLTAPSNRMQSLEDLLTACGELRVDKALIYLQQLAEALECCHAVHVVHRAVKPRSILIEAAPEKAKKKEKDLSEQAGVRLSEAAWYQRLIDLNKSDPWVVSGAEEEIPDSWICPEAIDQPFVYEKGRDMWELGVVFAQMLFGLDVYLRYSSPVELVKSISRGAASEVRKVLADLLASDAKKRMSAARLSALLQENTLGDVSTTYVGGSITTTTTKSMHWPLVKGSATPITSPPPPNQSKSVDDQVGFFWQPRASGSRYRSEFEELEFLGRGGGGQVVKARNRLDGHLYAVKKIRLPNDKASEIKILREVTIWSRMNHPNIVRYHTSWVETDDMTGSHADLEDSSTQLTDTGTTKDTVNSGTDSQTDGDGSESGGPSDFEEDEDGSSKAGFDLDLDLGLEDLAEVDFLSVSRSKSISYPSIHFGNEDDVSRATSASTKHNSPVVSRQITRGPSPVAPTLVRTLYIQMEYVERLTLKEAIEDGVSEVDSWRLMFQILSAMLHFTSLNIIHRDLKPSNIFLDVNGDVRIGDFGLAVNQGLADPADVLLSGDSGLDDVDLTSGVGTSLYIAPETISRGRDARSIKYSNKIDMYSLGIVFFELWHPFKTGMERIQVLRELRKPDIVFPPTWNAARLSKHTKIVQTCLVHDPEIRASPRDLLNSDLLPPRVGDDSIEETIRMLSHSGTTHAQSLITALFNQTAEDRLRKDFSYDFYDGEGAKVDNDPYGEIVREKLSRVFRQKGAVCIDSPLLMPHSQIYASRKPVRLLDGDGTVVCLPFQLNIPFCRMVARDTSLSRLKRWTIAPVYRPSTAGGQPRAVLNAAFDIVSDAASAATEAECLFVVDEVMAAFPFTGEIIHSLNHTSLLDVVLDKIPPKRRAEALEILVQHSRSQRTWAKTAAELLKLSGVTRLAVDEMSALNATGNAAEIRKLLLSVRPKFHSVIKAALDELQDITKLGYELGIKHMNINPLLATNWDFHKGGVLFETHLVKGKHRDVLAAGGRFDDVVSRLAAPETRFSGRCPHVVGVSISVSKLSSAAAEENATLGKRLMTDKNESLRSYGSWAVRRCDVYVVSFIRDLVNSRLAIVKDLWKAGIKADLMYDDHAFLKLTPEQLVSACRREGILWLVIVKQGPERRTALDETDKALKVKSVLRGYEEEVSRSELAGWLTKEMREQLLIDETVSGTTIDPIAEFGSTHYYPKPTQDIYPILLDEDVRQKGRHKQRSMITSKAQKRVQTAAAAAAEAPVFALDIEGQPFASMCQSAAWVSDDDAFRAITQAALPTKRDYLTSVRQAIRKHREAHPELASFWIFSLREDRTVLLAFHES